MIARKHVVLVAQRPSDFVEMRRAALALAPRGHRVTFLYHLLRGADAHNAQVLEQLRELEAAGVCERSEIVGAPGAGEGRGGPSVAAKRFSLRAWGQSHPRFDRVLRAPLVQVAVRLVSIALHMVRRARAFGIVLRHYLARRRRYREWLRRVQADIIVLPEDVVGYVTAVVIRSGHDLGIPSLILPYTVANQLEAFQSLRSNPEFRLEKRANRIIGRLFPRWVMRRDGDAALRLPVLYVVGHVLTGTSPPDPWMMNSGFANRIAVENEVMLDYYLRAGIPAAKMEVVGALSDDDLARYRGDKPAALAAVRAEIGIDGERPLLLVGGCPNQRQGAPGFDFPGYEEMVDHMLDCLQPVRQHYAIVMRPHPNFFELRHLFEKRGIPCTTIETARLVAVADVYVAFASATLRWAIACGIPSVNYDVFHYDYGDFRSVPGVQNVSRPEEFRQAVAQLMPSSEAFRALRTAAEAEMARWGRLDGRSADRIEALIERLCAVRPAPRTSA